MKPEVKKLFEDLRNNSHKNITIFSLNGCPACMELKKKLDRLNVVYEDIDMSENPHKWKDLESMGGKDYVPQVIVDNTLINEYDNSNELLSKILSEVVDRKIIIK